jgi:hypothetical protein
MLDGGSDESLDRGVDFYRFDGERPLFCDEYKQAARDYGFCDACIDEACESESYGFATEETEQGFVNGFEFATKAEYDEALADAQSAALESE